MDGKAPDPVGRHIDYHLNQLGVRVFENACQLISRTNDGWSAMGSRLPLPLQIPLDATQLQPGNVMQETAFHIMQRNPELDLRALLQQETPFHEALAAALGKGGN